MVANRTRVIRRSKMTSGVYGKVADGKDAKRAGKAATPKQPSLGLRLRAPYLYPELSSLMVAKD
jgi:hypothetical protein